MKFRAGDYVILTDHVGRETNEKGIVLAAWEVPNQDSPYEECWVAFYGLKWPWDQEGRRPASPEVRRIYASKLRGYNYGS